MEVLYKHSSAIHNTRSAEVIVPVLSQYLSPFTSVLDVGCGTGSWLKIVSEKCGVIDFIGMDGNYINRDMLLIPEANFRAWDLRRPFNLARSFDLLICTEVAEHLPEEAAEGFIDSLCRHSTTIVFSSAIPGQGGQNHINEQWPDYWKNKFLQRGFTRLDIIRPEIWINPSVDIWYRQNLFVFTTNAVWIDKYSGISVSAEVHPDLWSMKINALNKVVNQVNSFDKGGAGISRSWRALLNAMMNRR